MQLIPYKSFTIKSQDPPAVVSKRLAHQIEAPKTIRFFLNRNHAPYAGYISDNSFKITRIIHYRNSFLPVIRGQIEPVGSGTHVHVKMNLHPLVLGFLGVWCSTWFGFVALFISAGEMPIGLGIPLIGMPLLIFIAFWCAFWFEVNKSSGDLIAFIQGYPPSSSFQNRGFFNHRGFQWLLTGLSLIIFVVLIGLFSNRISVPFLDNKPAPPEQISCLKTPSISALCDFKLAHRITGHPQASIIAMSPQHQILVSGGEDKALKVWDLNTGELKQTFQSDSGVIHSIAISPDGRFIVSGSGDQMVRVWSLETGKPQAILKGHGGDVNFVAISSNGQRILSGSNDGVFKSWNLNSGNFKTTLSANADQVSQVAPVKVTDKAKFFSPQALNSDGNIALAKNSWDDITAWDLEKSKNIQTLKSGFTSHTLSAHISPEGQFAVVEYGNNFKKYQTFFKVWDLTTGKVLAKNTMDYSQNKSQQIFRTMPITVNHDHIIGSKNGSLKIWSLKTGKLEASINANFMRSLVIDSRSNTIAGLTGDSYYQNAQIEIWQRS